LLITTLPPTRAGAEDADLAVEPGLGAQPLHRALGVADDLRIGHAALGAHLGRDVVRFAFAGAVVEVMADRRVAVMREFSGGLAVPLVPARRMVKEHHAGERTRPQRPRDVGRDGLVVSAVNRDRLCNHAFVRHHRHPFFSTAVRAIISP
jgi:hypothetical protein